MKPSFKNTAITLGLLAILGGGVYYSATDRKQEVATQLAIENKNKQQAEIVELSRFSKTSE
jgi:uncharacterized protein YdgA (DUF945 family)